MKIKEKQFLNDFVSVKYILFLLNTSDRNVTLKHDKMKLATFIFYMTSI